MVLAVDRVVILDLVGLLLSSVGDPVLVQEAMGVRLVSPLVGVMELLDLAMMVRPDHPQAHPINGAQGATLYVILLSLQRTQTLTPLIILAVMTVAISASNIVQTREQLMAALLKGVGTALSKASALIVESVPAPVTAVFEQSYLVRLPLWCRPQCQRRSSVQIKDTHAGL